jgi:hypothetical protein
MKRGMWALVDARLATMHELQTTLTLDQYAEAWEYLQAKRAAEAKANRDAQRAHGRAGR